MRRRRHPSISSLLRHVALSYLQSLLGVVPPEQKEAILTLIGAIFLDLKLKSPLLEMLKDGSKSHTPSQESHYRNRHFLDEFGGKKLFFLKFITLTLKASFVTELIKNGIDFNWLYPLEDLEGLGFSKGYLAEWKAGIIFDYAHRFVMESLEGFDEIIGFYCRWENLWGPKDLHFMLHTYEEMLNNADGLIPHEMLMEYRERLERYKRREDRDEITQACGKPARRNTRDGDFREWDLWNEGLSLTEIALKLYPSLCKKVALERVRRRRDRHQRMIYGSTLTDKKTGRLLSLDPVEHLKSCDTCRDVKDSDHCCQLMQDYLNLECRPYQREWTDEKRVALVPDARNPSEDDLIERIDMERAMKY